jgi:hypothetical protein
MPETLNGVPMLQHLRWCLSYLEAGEGWKVERDGNCYVVIRPDGMRSALTVGGRRVHLWRSQPAQHDDAVVTSRRDPLFNSFPE